MSDFVYRGYRLHLYSPGVGEAIAIYPPQSKEPLAHSPCSQHLGGMDELMVEACHIVDADIRCHGAPKRGKRRLRASARASRE